MHTYNLSAQKSARFVLELNNFYRTFFHIAVGQLNRIVIDTGNCQFVFAHVHIHYAIPTILAFVNLNTKAVKHSHRNDSGLLGVIICTTASESMVNDITTLIKQELNIDVKYINDSHNIVDVCLYKQEDIKTFYNWIYDNSSIYLQRKYDKFAVLRTSHKDS